MNINVVKPEEQLTLSGAVECYYVCVEDLIKKGTFGGGGGHLSIEDAIASVESRVDIKWLL